MTIQAKSADGVMHEFPDGTADDVIDRVMKDYAKTMPSISKGLARSFVEGVPILGPLAKRGVMAASAAVAPFVDPYLPDGSEKLPEATFGERYQHLSDYMDAQERGFTAQHPYLDTGAQVAGGVASLAAAGTTATGARLLGLTGETLPQMIAGGAASGAGITAADTYLRGDLANPDPEQIGIAAAEGGLVAGVAPGVGRAVSAITEPVRSVVRGITDKVGEGARRVALASEADELGLTGRRLTAARKAGEMGLSPREFNAAKAAGLPVAVIDTGGEHMRALARSAANSSPEARAVLNQFIKERYKSQSTRLADWLQSRFHFPDPAAQQEAIQQTAREVNRPAYARAYAHPAAKQLWDEGFQQLSAAPLMQDAMRAAGRTGANKAALEGFRQPVNPFRFAEDGTMTLKGNRGPSLQFWDSVKQNLDDKIGALQRSGEKAAARDALGLKQALVNRIDEAVPAYKEARQGAAGFFDAENALEAGQKAVTSKMNNAQIRAGLAKMKPSEKQLFQDGFVGDYVEKIRNAPDSRNTLNMIANSPAARERLQLALGTQGAKELEVYLRMEGVMDLARSAVQGNSTTTRQLVELGLAGGWDLTQSGGHPFSDPQALMNAALVYGAARGSRVIDQRVAAMVARQLTSTNRRQLLKGIRTLSANPTLFKALQNFDASMAAIAARGIAGPKLPIDPWQVSVKPGPTSSGFVPIQ
jgi:hypothetical protein